MGKLRPLAKRLEIDVLLDQIFRLTDEGKTSVSPELQPLLIAESSRSRGTVHSHLLKTRHYHAAENLSNNPDITIRRADKAVMFVLIPSEQYVSKLDSIVHYCFKSSREFLDCVNSAPAEGVMASLDVESLFTNIPVLRTIDYICDHVYRSSPLPLLKIEEIHLHELLKICTQEAVFCWSCGNLYQQIDGRYMGSPFGVVFANSFMGSGWDEVFNRFARPLLYGRYVDDVFVRTTDSEERERLLCLLQEVSSLQLTTEEATDGVLPFLEVLLTQNADGSTHTAVYTKPTDQLVCA
ncbi:uncharacterized protein LOC143026962 [Oratosquilla oratoria]|uniref:uncharacterized protein LOC143026962 n=1 Tax=Oratosquilla oratoria TaxID=337810 RepID=UPI003F776708